MVVKAQAVRCCSGGIIRRRFVVVVVVACQIVVWIGAPEQQWCLLQRKGRWKSTTMLD